MAKAASPLVPPRRPQAQASPEPKTFIEEPAGKATAIDRPNPAPSPETFIKGAKIEKDSPRTPIPPKGPSMKAAVTIFPDEREAIGQLLARAREGSFIIGDEARSGAGIKTFTENNVIRQLLLQGLRENGVLE